jgi:hypothetical protein
MVLRMPLACGWEQPHAQYFDGLCLHVHVHVHVR